MGCRSWCMSGGWVTAFVDWYIQHLTPKGFACRLLWGVQLRPNFYKNLRVPGRVKCLSCRPREFPVNFRWIFRWISSVNFRWILREFSDRSKSSPKIQSKIIRENLREFPVNFPWIFWPPKIATPITKTQRLLIGFSVAEKITALLTPVFTEALEKFTVVLTGHSQEIQGKFSENSRGNHGKFTENSKVCHLKFTPKSIVWSSMWKQHVCE